MSMVASYLRVSARYDGLVLLNGTPMERGVRQHRIESPFERGVRHLRWRCLCSTCADPRVHPIRFSSAPPSKARTRERTLLIFHANQPCVRRKMLFAIAIAAVAMCGSMRHQHPAQAQEANSCVATGDQPAMVPPGRGVVRSLHPSEGRNPLGAPGGTLLAVLPKPAVTLLGAATGRELTFDLYRPQSLGGVASGRSSRGPPPRAFPCI